MTKITAGVDRASGGIRERLEVMFNTITSDECPTVTIGKTL